MACKHASNLNCSQNISRKPILGTQIVLDTELEIYLRVPYCGEQATFCIHLT